MRDTAGRFAPGTSGNPGGRPRGRSFLALLERALDAEVPGERTRMEALVEKLLAMAEAGDVRALDLVLRRISPERLSIDGMRDSGPLVIIRDYTRISTRSANSAGPRDIGEPV